MTNLDLRPSMAQAQRWVQTLVAGTRPDQLGADTPCSEFRVRELIAHLVGVNRRIAALGGGQAALAVNALPTDIDDAALADAYRVAMADAERAWTDDAALDREVVVPWGTQAGWQVLGTYVGEVLTHGWDLAVATGQPAEAPAPLAQTALGIAKRAIPGGARDAFPFDPPVDPARDAGLTEQLANWEGRTSRPRWVN